MLAQILPGFRDFRTPLVTEATSVVISALEIETIKSNVLNVLTPTENRANNAN